MFMTKEEYEVSVKQNRDALIDAYRKIVPNYVADRVDHISTMKAVVAGEMVVVHMVAATPSNPKPVWDCLIEKRGGHWLEAGFLVVPVDNLNRSSKSVLAYFEKGKELPVLSVADDKFQGELVDLFA